MTFLPHRRKLVVGTDRARQSPPPGGVLNEHKMPAT
jgi:hypothetical protein